MSTKTYANFNSATFQGRIFDATVANGQYGEFVAITVITNLSDDSEGVTVTFNNSNGLLSLAKKGHLTKGRMVHVTGHISGITEVYEKDGVTQLLKRPRLTLDSNTAQLVLGAVAKSDAPQRPTGVVTVKRTATATEDPTPQVATPPVAAKEYF